MERESCMWVHSGQRLKIRGSMTQADVDREKKPDEYVRCSKRHFTTKLLDLYGRWHSYLYVDLQQEKCTSLLDFDGTSDGVTYDISKPSAEVIDGMRTRGKV
jgi:hypothetical protein